MSYITAFNPQMPGATIKDYQCIHCHFTNIQDERDIPNSRRRLYLLNQRSKIQGCLAYWQAIEEGCHPSMKAAVKSSISHDTGMILAIDTILRIIPEYDEKFTEVVEESSKCLIL